VKEGASEANGRGEKERRGKGLPTVFFLSVMVAFGVLTGVPVLYHSNWGVAWRAFAG